jgi:lauroyl/myristoyl acyltransferase
MEVAGLAIMSRVRNILSVARPLDNELLERELQQIRRAHGRQGRGPAEGRARAAQRTRGEQRARAAGRSSRARARRRPRPVSGASGMDYTGGREDGAPRRLDDCVRFCIPDGLRHRLEFEEPIRADLLSGGERDPVELTKRINDIISRRIHARPELWLWMHDRWKGTGEGDVKHGV